MKRFYGLVFLFLSGVAFADEVAELRPSGTTTLIFRGKSITIRKPTTISLREGDQLCVTAGKLEFLRGTRKQKYVLSTGRCLQILPPRNDAQSVMGFVESLINNPKTFETQGAMSRDVTDCKTCTAPALHIPQDFSLPNLLLPISGRPNPKTLKIVDAQGTVLFSSQNNQDNAVFVIPIAKIRKGVRLEIRNLNKDVLYAARIFIVDFGNSTPLDPTEAARYLLETGLLEYAPAAFSYLVSAGATDESARLESLIRSSFSGG